MSKGTRIFLVNFLVGGVVFAAIMLGFDYFTHKEYNVLKYIVYFVAFGLFMGLMARRNYRNRVWDDEENEEDNA